MRTSGLTLREQARIFGYDYDPPYPESALEAVLQELIFTVELQLGTCYASRYSLNSAELALRDYVRARGLKAARALLDEAEREGLACWQELADQHGYGHVRPEEVSSIRQVLEQLLASIYGPAAALHRAMGRLGIRRHYDAAGLLLGRPVQHFSELSHQERQRLWDALAELQAVGVTAAVEADGKPRLISLSALRQL